MPPCEPGFASMPRTTHDVGSDLRITTPVLKAGQSITKRCNAFGAKNGFEYRSAAAANATAAPPHQRP